MSEINLQKYIDNPDYRPDTRGNLVRHWLEVSLGYEIAVAGGFIYNGLLAFDQLKDFDAEAVIFEFFYNISIGIERLGKLTVLLSEFTCEESWKDVLKEIKHHNHLKLFRRVEKKYTSTLSNKSWAFLNILEGLYKEMRYERYSLGENFSHGQEADLLKVYISEHLGSNVPQLERTDNTSEIKIAIGEVVGEIVEFLYGICLTECNKRMVYPYAYAENADKSSKIFSNKEYNFVVRP